MKIRLVLLTSLLALLFSFTTVAQEADNNETYEEFSLSVFEEYTWVNCGNVKQYLGASNMLHVLVYLTESAPDFDYTLRRIHTMAAQHSDVQFTLLYNAEDRVERNPERFKAMVLNRNITLPIALIDDKAFIDGMGIEEYPIAFLYTENAGSIKFYSDLMEMETIPSDLSYLKSSGDHPELFHERDTKNYLKNLVSQPLVQNIRHIEAAPSLNALFVSSSDMNRICMINLSGQVVMTIGTGNPGHKDSYASTAEFNYPAGMSWNDADSVLYVADQYNNCIRKVELANMQKVKVSTIISPEAVIESTSTEMAFPSDVAWHNNNLYIAFSGANEVWTYNLESNTTNRYNFSFTNESDSIRTEMNVPFAFLNAKKESIKLINTGDQNMMAWNSKGMLEDYDYEKPDYAISSMASSGKNWAAVVPYANQIILYDGKKIKRVVGGDEFGFKDGKRNSALFSDPFDITYMGGQYYITDRGSNTIRAIKASNGKVKTLVVNYAEPLVEARLNDEHQLEYYHLEELVVDQGPVEVVVKLDLDDQYEMVDTDLNRVVNMEAAAGSVIQYVIEDGDISDGNLKISLENGEVATYSRIRIHMNYRDKAFPHKVYYKTVHINLTYDYQYKGENNQKVVIPIH